MFFAKIRKITGFEKNLKKIVVLFLMSKDEVEKKFEKAPHLFIYGSITDVVPNQITTKYLNKIKPDLMFNSRNRSRRQDDAGPCSRVTEQSKC